MTTTLQEILNFDFFNFLDCLTPNVSLNMEVKTTGILEFEYEAKENPTHKFDSHTLVLTSLYFAREKPEILLPTIRMLQRDGVAGLFVKRIFFDTLPQEVLIYAKENHFPIFTYEKKDTPHFEDIILKVKEVLSFEQGQHYLETMTAEMMRPNGTSRELEKYFFQKIAYSPTQFQVIYFQTQADRLKIRYWLSLLTEFHLHFLTTEGIQYRDGFFLFVSVNKTTPQFQTDSLLQQLQFIGIPVQQCWIGSSTYYHDFSKIKYAFQEAFISATNSFLYQIPFSAFSEIGVMQWLIPHSQQPELQEFSQNIFRKLDEGDRSSNKKLGQTARIFVESEGDIKQMSEKMQIHENSIRYRLQKLREIFGTPQQPLSLYALYQQLDIAFKTLLSHKQIPE